MASFLRLIFSVLQIKAIVLGLQIPLNNRASDTLLNFDGHWPTVPVLYGSGLDRLDSHMTFWTESIFVLQQQCPVVGYGMICPNNSAPLKPVPAQPPDVDQKANMTQMMLDAFDLDVLPEIGNLLGVLHINGEADWYG